MLQPWQHRRRPGVGGVRQALRGCFGSIAAGDEPSRGAVRCAGGPPEDGSEEPRDAKKADDLIAVQLLHLLDLVLYGIVLAHSFELGPCVELGGADEIESTRAFAFGIA